MIAWRGGNDRAASGGGGRARQDGRGASGGAWVSYAEAEIRIEIRKRRRTEGGTSRRPQAFAPQAPSLPSPRLSRRAPSRCAAVAAPHELQDIGGEVAALHEMEGVGRTGNVRRGRGEDM